MFASADTEYFERQAHRMRARSSIGTRFSDETRFICVVDPGRTELERVSKQLQRDGVRVAHCLEFINTLVVFGNPEKVRSSAAQITGIKSLIMRRAGRTGLQVLPISPECRTLHRKTKNYSA
jgi:hypothetical protein